MSKLRSHTSVICLLTTTAVAAKAQVAGTARELTDGMRRNLRLLPVTGVFCLGVICATAIPVTLSELLLRARPPSDLEQYLGASPGSSGAFRTHPDLGVTYRSWDCFLEQNREHLSPHLPLTGHPDPRPVWAFFGNSFIQAPGMLGDVVTDAVPERRILYLKRNELLPVRLAQIELLLDAGLRPERIFVELMPIDILPLVRNPLDSYDVTSSGALTFRPRMPPGWLRWPAEHSRLVFTGWIRSGLHQRRHGDLCRALDATVRGDLDRLFGHLARKTAACGVPVSVILIPAYEQSVGESTFAFTDSVTEVLSAHGLEVVDPRREFAGYSEPRELYIPDKHLSGAGNQLLLSALLQDVSVASHADPERMQR